MWRSAGQAFLLLGRAEVCAKVPGGATWIRATPAASTLCPGVTCGSFPASVLVPGCGGVTHTTAAPHRLLHTTAAPHRLLHTTAAPHRLLHTTPAPHRLLHTTPAPHRLLHTTATPHRLLHTTSFVAADSEVSTAVVEAEVDRLYSCVEVECRGHEPAVLRSYQKFVSTAASHLDIPLEKIEWPKKHIQRWTLLKSIHIHKKHRVQYEARTHFLVMKFARLTSSTADTFLEYIQRNLPEGVGMKVTMHEIQKLPQHVKPSPEVVV